MNTFTTEMVQPADVQALAASAERAVIEFVDAHKLDVVDLDTLAQAVTIRERLGEMKKTIAAKFAQPKKWAYDLHRWFCELERSALAPLDKLDVYEAGQIRSFKQLQDRLRDEEARRLADDQRRVREALAAQEAAQLESAGEHAMAAAVVEDAISAPPPVVALPDVTKGVAKFKRRFCWRYAGGPDDVAQTTPATIARTMKLIPRDFLCVDELKMNAFTRSMKGSATVAGIEFYHVDDPVR